MPKRSALPRLGGRAASLTTSTSGMGLAIARKPMRGSHVGPMRDPRSSCAQRATARPCQLTLNSQSTIVSTCAAATASSQRPSHVGRPRRASSAAVGSRSLLMGLNLESSWATGTTTSRQPILADTTDTCVSAFVRGCDESGCRRLRVSRVMIY